MTKPRIFTRPDGTKVHPQVTCRNSQIRSYQIVNHAKNHYRTPYELIWAYRQSGTGIVQVSWRFFQTASAAQQFARDLESAVIEADGSPKH
jgi:hypothetical protein